MPLSVFRDGSLAAEFDRDGYVVAPFLDSAQVARLRAVYERHHDEDDVRRRTIPTYTPGFYASTFNNDMAYRRALSDDVMDGCRSALQRTFAEYKVFYGG